MSIDLNKDLPVEYSLDVAKGVIPGTNIVAFTGRNQRTNKAFEDMWDVGGFSSGSTSQLTYATAAESWEIVSSSINDAAAGTGARAVRVFYLDDNYDPAFKDVVLNGTTVVSLSITDGFRFREAWVIDVGSSGWNEGDITVRVSGGGAARGGIAWDDTVSSDKNGLNSSLDSHYTVPSGFTFFPQLITVNTVKGDELRVRTQLKPFGAAAFLTASEIGVYQNNYVQNFSDTPLAIPEKSDLRVIGRSGVGDVVGIVQISGKLIENSTI